MRDMGAVYQPTMKPLKEIAHIRRPAKTNIRSERDEAIQAFVDKLNEAREGTKYPPLTPAAVAVKVAHLSVSDLWARGASVDMSGGR